MTVGPLLSEALRADIEHMFGAGLDKMALRYARLAAEARDMETEVSRLRLQLALLTEEG